MINYPWTFPLYLYRFDSLPEWIDRGSEVPFWPLLPLWTAFYLLSILRLGLHLDYCSVIVYMQTYIVKSFIHLPTGSEPMAYISKRSCFITFSCKQLWKNQEAERISFWWHGSCLVKFSHIGACASSISFILPIFFSYSVTC